MRAVLFDFDGVLVNSEPLHYAALRTALEPEGILIDEDEYARTYLAYDDWEAVRIALERNQQPSDTDRVDAIATRKAEIFDGLKRQIPFFPGAPALVRQLAAEYPLAIASGARRREIEAILASAGLRSAFAAIVGADDVDCTKPHPEPYLAALALVNERTPGIVPKECLVVEDSMAGIASALAAGMRVVAVASSYPAEKLAAAHRVFGSIAQLDVAKLRALFEE
jgi:beta-phosphoglucomutase